MPLGNSEGPKKDGEMLLWVLFDKASGTEGSKQERPSTYGMQFDPNCVSVCESRGQYAFSGFSAHNLVYILQTKPSVNLFNDPCLLVALARHASNSTSRRKFLALDLYLVLR
jgi:hypothetical protein